MILYTKTFPLGKGIRFSSYIKALGEQNFSPYTLLIEKIPETENYHIDIVLTDFIMGLRHVGAYFINGTLFSECTIQHVKGAREFTLRASVGKGNLSLVLLSTIPILCFLLFITLVIITRGMPLGAIFVFSVITIIVLLPLLSTCIRDKNRLERIGSLGSELNKE